MAAYCTTAVHTLYRPIRVAYLSRRENRTSVWVQYARVHWTKIIVAALCGIFSGFLAGTVTKGGFSPDRVVYAASPGVRAVAAKAPALSGGVSTPEASAAEVLRLRAENQQLQALLDTLRKHPATPAHARRAKAHRRRHGRAG